MNSIASYLIYYWFKKKKDPPKQPKCRLSFSTSQLLIFSNSVVYLCLLCAEVRSEAPRFYQTLHPPSVFFLLSLYWKTRQQKRQHKRHILSSSPPWCFFGAWYILPLTPHLVTLIFCRIDVSWSWSWSSF